LFIFRIDGRNGSAQLSLVAELFNVSLVSYLVVVTWLEKSGL
jgi:hypothetical protein